MTDKKELYLEKALLDRHAQEIDELWESYEDHCLGCTFNEFVMSWFERNKLDVLKDIRNRIGEDKKDAEEQFIKLLDEIKCVSIDEAKEINDDNKVSN